MTPEEEELEWDRANELWEQQNQQEEEEKRQAQRQLQRQAVKAWLDSPDFPGGAGTLVFATVGQAATAYADADQLLAQLESIAVQRRLDGGDDGGPEYILGAARLALRHHRARGHAPPGREPFDRFYDAAYDYCATENDEFHSVLSFRKKRDFRVALLKRIRQAARMSPDIDVRLAILANTLSAGVKLFPALRAHDGRRPVAAILRERLAGFDLSRLAKPIPLPDKGTADEGEAAEIALDLLCLAGLPRKAAESFLFGNGRQQKHRASATAALAGTAPPPGRSRRRSRLP